MSIAVNLPKLLPPEELQAAIDELSHAWASVKLANGDPIARGSQFIGGPLNMADMYLDKVAERLRAWRDSEVLRRCEDEPKKQARIEALEKAINEARMCLQMDAYLVGLPADSILKAALNKDGG